MHRFILTCSILSLSLTLPASAADISETEHFYYKLAPADGP